MASFPAGVLEAATREREVALKTFGRKTGKLVRVTIWIATDGQRIFIRSGGGLGRHWPRNLQHRGEAVLQLGEVSANVKARHVTDVAEARAVSQLYRKKYGSYVKPSKSTEPPTEGEKATFELLPID